MDSESLSPPADACAAYDAASERLRRSCRDLSHAEEEFQERKEGHEAARRTQADAEDAVHRCAEANFDALLSRPTQWNGMYRRLEDFKRRHGHCTIRRSVTDKDELAKMDPEEKKLGGWVGMQRRDARRPADHPEHIEWYKKVALDRLGFDWEPHDNKWAENYEKLKIYREEHGDCLVSSSKGTGLGKWVHRQRYLYARVKPGAEKGDRHMTPDRIKLLNELGFAWDPRAFLEERDWTTYFQLLAKFVTVNGHCIVPSDDKDPEMMALYNWVTRQRRQCKKIKAGKESDLTASQVRRLEAVDFLYVKDDINWMTMYQKLRAYKTLFGTTVVVDYNGEFEKLASWVRGQRVRLKLRDEGRHTKLSDEFAQLLEDVGLEQSVTEDEKKEAKAKRPPPSPNKEMRDEIRQEIRQEMQAKATKLPKGSVPGGSSPAQAQKRQRHCIAQQQPQVVHQPPAAAGGWQLPPVPPPYPYYYAPQAMYMHPPGSPWGYAGHHQSPRHAATAQVSKRKVEVSAPAPARGSAGDEQGKGKEKDMAGGSESKNVAEAKKAAADARDESL